MACNLSNSNSSTEIGGPFFEGFIVARRPGDNLYVITVDLGKQTHVRARIISTYYTTFKNKVAKQRNLSKMELV